MSACVCVCVRVCVCVCVYVCVRACVCVYLLCHTKTHIYSNHMPVAVKVDCGNMHLYMNVDVCVKYRLV